jgi:cell division ATPase FtsA
MKSKKEAVLNVGSEKLTLVVIDEKYPTSIVYELCKEYAGFQNGQFFEKHELFSVLSSMIQECEAAIFSKLESILVGVPGEFTITVIKDIQTQLSQTRRKIYPKDAHELLLNAASEVPDGFIPINASPIFYILDSSEKTLNPEGSYAQYLGAKVSLVLCEKYFTDLFSNIFESIGRDIEYTSTLLAETMFLLPHTARDRGAFLLDVGYISSSLAYSKGDGILFSKSFSLGGGYIAADLMQLLDIPYEHAYILKSKINLNLNPMNSDMYYISVNDGN